jgi:PPP family 3-phenylpropionic acid transporter
VLPPAVSIILYYFLSFAGMGLFVPYLALYLTSIGLSLTDATRVHALLPLMVMLAPPLMGLAADLKRSRVRLMRILSVLMVLTFLGFLAASSYRLAVFVTAGLFAFVRAPLTSIADATAFEHVDRYGGSFGRLRLFGSLGFLLAVFLGGLLLPPLRPLVRFGVCAALWGLASVSAMLGHFPSARAPEGVEEDSVLAAWTGMLADRSVWVFLLCVTLAQLSHAGFDAGYSVYLSRLGYGDGFIGTAWAVGVVSEILLMALSARVIRRVGAERLMAFALLVATLRWWLLSFSTGAAALLGLQLLHGITFGYYYVSAVTLIHERGREAPTAAQGLLATAWGLGSVIGMWGVGAILSRGGGALLYSLSAVMAALATLIALVYARLVRARPKLAESTA